MHKAVLAVILLFPSAANAAELTCKKSPALTGKCSTVQGSLGLTPGIGVTLMSGDGTRTIIKAPPDSNADIAPVVMQNWLYWQSKTGSMRTSITGTFELCPLPPSINSAGIRDFGCINKGTRISQDKTSPGN
ncbi:MAG TPA: hypothetical protein VH189_14645 [Rhizomicrobium sp.]|nr:hypothetical protein [Rhizomicrobium sp.]